jgi:hypothetical protein
MKKSTMRRLMQRSMLDLQAKVSHTEVVTKVLGTEVVREVASEDATEVVLEETLILFKL